MLKRIRIETHPKRGGRITVIFPDGELREATVLTILGSGPVEVKTEPAHYVWIETTDQLIVDGEHVP